MEALADQCSDLLDLFISNVGLIPVVTSGNKMLVTSSLKLRLQARTIYVVELPNASEYLPALPSRLLTGSIFEKRLLEDALGLGSIANSNPAGTHDYTNFMLVFLEDRILVVRMRASKKNSLCIEPLEPEPLLLDDVEPVRKALATADVYH